jgi:hypothetical protein
LWRAGMDGCCWMAPRPCRECHGKPARAHLRASVTIAFQKIFIFIFQQLLIHVNIYEKFVPYKPSCSIVSTPSTTSNTAKRRSSSSVRFRKRIWSLTVGSFDGVHPISARDVDVMQRHAHDCAGNHALADGTSPVPYHTPPATCNRATCQSMQRWRDSVLAGAQMLSQQVTPSLLITCHPRRQAHTRTPVCMPGKWASQERAPQRMWLKAWPSRFMSRQCNRHSSRQVPAWQVGGTLAGGR